MEITCRVISGEGEEWGKMQGISGINDRYKIDGKVKNSIEDGEDKELIV